MSVWMQGEGERTWAGTAGMGHRAATSTEHWGRAGEGIAPPLCSCESSESSQNRYHRILA